MSQHDSLGDRMKQYESITKTHLMRRTPTIIRIDGRAFHTYARRFKTCGTPFSDAMHELMVATTQVLVNNIQTCVLGYTQSDEISLLLRDWDRHETQQWFDGGLQKIVSISASIASNAFNQRLLQLKEWGLIEFRHFAQFDSRAHSIPLDEVCNYFIWRQQDATRNSVQMLGHYHFSAKQMHGKSNPQVQDMLMLDRGVNWNDIPTWAKRGACVTRAGVDEEIPIFTADREYIERHLVPKGEVSDALQRP